MATSAVISRRMFSKSIADCSAVARAPSTLPYKRKIEEDPALTGKKVLVKQHGIKGYKIKRTRNFTYADGTRRKEDMTDTYPPTTEIYHVPVGFDVSAR